MADAVRVDTWLLLLLRLMAPEDVTLRIDAEIAPFCATEPAALSVNVLVTLDPLRVVVAVAALVTLALPLLLRNNCPKALPVLLSVMPVVPAEEGAAVKLATPPTVKVVPVPCTMPVCALAGVVRPGFLVVMLIAPVIWFPE